MLPTADVPELLLAGMPPRAVYFAFAISARGQQYLDAALSFGACHTFPKPFESELFVQAVATVMSTLSS